MSTRSQAKLMMIKFLKDTRDTNLFKFKLRGDEADAKRFVHRMRVELSRMRDTVKESGRVPKEFKVLLEDIIFDPMEGIAEVHLKKAEGNSIEIAEEVNDIFDEIAGGVAIK